MLRADVIVGALWGDEGKGKFVGYVGHGYDAVLRVNASTNAGHCVNDGKTTYVTRQLPSVFFPKQTRLVVAPGALMNLNALADEIRERPDRAELRGKVLVASSVALLIRPYVEKGQGGRSLLMGSTHQGTGPAAVARTARHALRLWDVQHAAQGGEAERREVLQKIADTCRETSPDRFGKDAASDGPYHRGVLDELLGAWRYLSDVLGGEFCVDYTALLVEDLRAGDKKILLEGCNGLLLDNLHGALPHVTSASTNVAAMLCGANLAPVDAGTVTVVMAAYANCLGKRPFPTEVPDSIADPILARCNEIDVAQGQKRRLGWLDAPALRKALAGCSGAVLHLNKLDALTGTLPLKICTHYEVGGRELAVMPDDPSLVAQAKPKLMDVAGWTQDLRGAREWSALPEAARAYVKAVQALLPNRIVSVGTGPANSDRVDVPVP